MIEVINRELLIPREEYNIGTCYDDNTETRHFHLKRVTSGGVDLAALTFNLDIQYADGNTDAASLVKEVTDKDINLVLTINNSMLQVPGTVLVQIRALDEDGVCKWTSYKSAFFVEDHINTPGHYEGDLTQLEQYEAEWGKVRDNVNQLNSRMDQVVKIREDSKATDVEEEVLDGRVGYDGTLYGSLGSAVRKQVEGVYDFLGEVTHNHPKVSAMLLDTSLKDGMCAKTEGYYTPEDGGGALYLISQTIPSGYYITLSNGLYAKIINNTFATPEMFGAKGDGITDDTQAILNAIAASKHIIFGSKKYKISSSVIVPSAGYLIEGISDSIRGGDGEQTIKNATTILTNENIDIFYFTDANGCCLKNLLLVGNGTESFSNTQGCGIRLPNSSYNFKAENITIEKIGVGIKCSNAWNLLLEKVLVYYTNNAFEVDHITDLVLIKCVAYFSNKGLYTIASSVSAFDFYSDNCYYGLDINSVEESGTRKFSMILIDRLFTEGGRDVGPNVATSIKSDGYCDIDIYGMNVYDNSGNHTLCNIQGGSEYHKVKIFGFTSDNMINFDLGENAKNGCMEMHGFFGKYFPSIPAKVLVNGDSSAFIHGVAIDQKMRRYRGNSQKNMIIVTGKSSGKVTLFSNLNVESVEFFNSDGTLKKSANSNTNLIVTRNSSGNVQIEHSSGVTDFRYEIDVLTNGFCTQSDNTWS